MVVFGCLIYFNDGPKMLEDSIMAMKRANLEVVTVDGAYREFPHERHFSTDGCTDVAKSLASIHIDAPKGRPWDDQAEKRNTYFEAIDTGDYGIVIDADEMLLPCDFKKIQLTEPIYRIMLISVSTKRVHFSTVRVYKKYPDLKYLYQHCRIYRADQHFPEKDMESGVQVSAHSGKNGKYPILGCHTGGEVTIEHLCHQRPEERLKDKTAYYQTRAEAKMGYARPKNETGIQRPRRIPQAGPAPQPVIRHDFPKLKVGLAVPVSGRLEISRLAVRRLLRQQWCEMFIVLVADIDYDFKLYSNDLLEYGGRVVVVSHGGYPLGSKWQYGIDFLRLMRPDIDYYLHIGSDDFICDEYCVKGHQLLKKHGGAYAGVRGFYVMRFNATTKTFKMVFWRGYKGDRKDEPLGAGRLIPRETMETLNWDLMDKSLNTHLDRAVTKKLLASGGALLLNDHLKDVHVLGVKRHGGSSISKFEDYAELGRPVLTCERSTLLSVYYPGLMDQLLK